MTTSILAILNVAYMFVLLNSLVNISDLVLNKNKKNEWKIF